MVFLNSVMYFFWSYFVLTSIFMRTSLAFTTQNPTGFTSRRIPAAKQDGYKEEHVTKRTPPWAEKHQPPPEPFLPPEPPLLEVGSRGRNALRQVDSVCSLPVCSCKNRTQNGKEVVDIECRCRNNYRIFTMGEPMLPDKADTLSISDCDQVHLMGMSGGSPRRNGVGGRRGIGGQRMRNFDEMRRKREVGTENPEEGIEWEEAVWEAEVGPIEDEEEYHYEELATEPEETYGEESEKGGRYAREAPTATAPLSSLTVTRVQQLTLFSHAVGPVRSVRLDTIDKIVALPPYAFQPYTMDVSPVNGTGVKWEMVSVTFVNVSLIERVYEHAFDDVSISSHFLWIEVHMALMDDNAVRIVFPRGAGESGDLCGNYSEEAEWSLNEETVEEDVAPCEAPRGSFTLAGSVVGALGIMAFNIMGAQLVSFDGCHISELAPSSIMVRDAISFSFTRNYLFRSVAMMGFDVVANSVEMRRNRFGRLEEKAFLGIEPLEGKGLDRPRLDISENLFEQVDAMSLNVGWSVFSNFSRKNELPNLKGFSFRDNSFADCSCPHVGWITQAALDDKLFSSFYLLVLDKKSGNYCPMEPIDPMGLHLSCRLPLGGIRYLFEKDGVTCKRRVNAEHLCAEYSGSTATATSWTFGQLFALVLWTVYHLFGSRPVC